MTDCARAVGDAAKTGGSQPLSRSNPPAPNRQRRNASRRVSGVPSDANKRAASRTVVFSSRFAFIFSFFVVERFASSVAVKELGAVDQSPRDIVDRFAFAGGGFRVRLDRPHFVFGRETGEHGEIKRRSDFTRR